MKNYPILTKIGLSPAEATIYELLLEKGRSKASDLVKPSGLERVNTYHVLNNLQKKGLILVISGKTQLYEAVDPSNLRALVQDKWREAERLKGEFEDYLPNLRSEFQLSTGRPSVEIFEGVDGLQQAISDSVASKTEILSYLDVSAITGNLAKYNREYVKKRIRAGINKRIIVTDSPEAHAFFEKQGNLFTNVAFVPAFPANFQTAMEIYDGTVSYLTLTLERKIAVIIRDQAIYDLHKKQFDYLWANAQNDQNNTNYYA